MEVSGSMENLAKQYLHKFVPLDHPYNENVLPAFNCSPLINVKKGRAHKGGGSGTGGVRPT